MSLLTPTEMGREFGMHRRAVIAKCMELGVPIFQGRIDSALFAAKLNERPEPKSAAPRGEAPKQDPPVDWRARSQGLEEALRRIADLRRDTLPRAIAREALAAALGLPDEEGEERHED